MEHTIQTPCGLIRGTDCQVPGVIAYRGIRYATAGRWEYPRLVNRWEGVYDATQYGHCSYQPRAFYDEELNEKKYFYYNEFRKGCAYTYSEDCLFLNIWTPENAVPDSGLPVLVYIHGGGYTGGCGHEKHFDGPVWPTKGVIGVTINYRLGPLGFLCLPEQMEEAGHTGNYGLFDQLAALQWVQRNIRAFGGDPEKVTLMGQSAGAMSVQHHCQSPLTEGLFRAAVMSSGCGANAMMTGSVEKSCAFWKEVMARCGCINLKEFRAIPVENLFHVWKLVKGNAMAAMPVKDNCFVVEGAAPKKIPYMVGSNSHDTMPPILHSMAKGWGISNGVKNYVWHFDRMLPGDDAGAWHSSDLWYWFGTLGNCWRPMEEKDQALSDQMTSYLCNFVRTGNPNNSELPPWNPCTKREKNILCLGEGETAMGKPDMGKMIVTMLTNKAVGE